MLPRLPVISVSLLTVCLVAARSLTAEPPASPELRSVDAVSPAATNSANDGESGAVSDALSPSQIALRDKVRRCLAYYFFERPKNAKQHSPWCIMHGIVGFGVDAAVLADGRRMNAISWLCTNQPSQGVQLMRASAGQLTVRSGPGYQGHAGQLLSVLAMAGVAADHPLAVDDQRLTVADLVREEQLSCRAGTELSFKLVGLAHYLDSETTWSSSDQQDWDLARMVREELAQPINGVACGGTHRLMGLSCAVQKRQQEDRPMTGQWWRAQRFVNDYHAYIFKLQNADGSFSTNWFRGPGNSGGAPRKLNTTGHTLEWLIVSLPREQLTDPHVVKAVDFLAEMMWQQRGQTWEIGPEGHALRALALYDEYVFGGRPGERHLQLAEARVGQHVRTVDRKQPVPARQRVDR